MLYTWTDLIWLFFIYSFGGWCIEVCYAAVRRRKFVNRGFVNSPLCPIYGFGSLLFGIFLPELQHSWNMPPEWPWKKFSGKSSGITPP